MSDKVKLHIDLDGEQSRCVFDNTADGAKALGELIFAAFLVHAAYIMITPDDIEDLIEEENDKG